MIRLPTLAALFAAAFACLTGPALAGHVHHGWHRHHHGHGWHRGHVRRWHRGRHWHGRPVFVRRGRPVYVGRPYPVPVYGRPVIVGRPYAVYPRPARFGGWDSRCTVTRRVGYSPWGLRKVVTTRTCVGP